MIIALFVWPGLFALPWNFISWYNWSPFQSFIKYPIDVTHFDLKNSNYTHGCISHTKHTLFNSNLSSLPFWIFSHRLLLYAGFHFPKLHLPYRERWEIHDWPFIRRHMYDHFHTAIEFIFGLYGVAQFSVFSNLRKNFSIILQIVAFMQKNSA